MNEICLSCKKHTKCGRAEHETIGCGYYVPLTEQEWLQTATTEQLAEELLAWWFDGATMAEAKRWLKKAGVLWGELHE